MIGLGCDHGGYELMQEVKKHLEERGLEYEDFGCYSRESQIIRFMPAGWERPYWTGGARREF